MPRGGQGDNLLFKEGGVTKRSMPPSFHANLFALAAARYRCHDIGGSVIGALGVRFLCINVVQTNLTPLRQIRWGGPDGGAQSRGVICVGVRAARYTSTAQTMALPAGAPSVR